MGKESTEDKTVECNEEPDDCNEEVSNEDEEEASNEEEDASNEEEEASNEGEESANGEEESSKDIEAMETEENYNKNNYVQKRSIAEGIMDISLLTANANQLRFVMTYNTKSSMYAISLSLIILSLILQVFVGIAIILKRTSSKTSRNKRTNQLHVAGIFIITFINVLIAVFTTAGTDVQPDSTTTDEK